LVCILDAVDHGKVPEVAITEVGGECLFVHLDVTDEGSWLEAVAEAVSRFGLDILANNIIVRAYSLGHQLPNFLQWPSQSFRPIHTARFLERRNVRRSYRALWTQLVDLVAPRNWRDVARLDRLLRRSYALKPAYEPTVARLNVHETRSLNNRETP